MAHPHVDPFLLGDQCNRLHNRPTMSQTLLLSHMCFGHARTPKLLSSVGLPSKQGLISSTHGLLQVGCICRGFTMRIFSKHVGLLLAMCKRCVSETKPKGIPKTKLMAFSLSPMPFTCRALDIHRSNLDPLGTFSGLLRQLNFANL